MHAGAFFGDFLNGKEENVSLIHLDVEGAEIKALKGAQEVLKKSRPVLCLEELGSKRLSDYEWFKENIIKKLNYERCEEPDENVVFRPNSEEDE